MSPQPSRERGVALMLALFVLTTLAMLALFLGSSVTANRRITSDEVTKLKAMRVAEAGVNEALNRIQADLGPDPAAVNAASKVVQILLSASPGTAGPDTTLLATGQPAGAWLPYSTAGKGGSALTIEFKTDAARTKIYKYDKAQNPPLQFTSGSPVYRITSLGTVGGSSRRLVVEVIKPSSSTLDLRGALVTGTEIKYSGSNLTCGYNHRVDTPDHKGVPGRTISGGCNENAGLNQWETGSGDMPGDLVYGKFGMSGSNVHEGVPGVLDYQTGFYAGPWEALGMTQSAFFSWVGAPVSKPAVPVGVYYVDNDATPQNKSCPVSYTSPVVGSGLLYVDGDLTLSNDFHFRGLVYCEGVLKASNQAWILGSIVGAGKNVVSGPNVFLFCSDAVKAIPGLPSPGTSGKVKVIAWKEIQ